MVCQSPVTTMVLYNDAIWCHIQAPVTSFGHGAWIHHYYSANKSNNNSLIIDLCLSHRGLMSPHFSSGFTEEWMIGKVSLLDWLLLLCLDQKDSCNNHPEVCQQEIVYNHVTHAFMELFLRIPSSPLANTHWFGLTSWSFQHYMNCCSVCYRPKSCCCLHQIVSSMDYIHCCSVIKGKPIVVEVEFEENAWPPSVMLGVLTLMVIFVSHPALNNGLLCILWAIPMLQAMFKGFL